MVTEQDIGLVEANGGEETAGPNVRKLLVPSEGIRGVMSMEEISLAHREKLLGAADAPVSSHIQGHFTNRTKDRRESNADFDDHCPATFLTYRLLDL